MMIVNVTLEIKYFKQKKIIFEFMLLNINESCHLGKTWRRK